MDIFLLAYASTVDSVETETAFTQFFFWDRRGAFEIEARTQYKLGFLRALEALSVFLSDGTGPFGRGNADRAGGTPSFPLPRLEETLGLL